MKDLNATEVTVSANPDGEQFGYPTVTIDLETKWDTSIVIDLTVDDARTFAAELLRVADRMQDA